MQFRRERFSNPNMSVEEEKRALRRILKAKWNAEYPQIRNLFRLQQQFSRLAEIDIENAIGSLQDHDDPQAVLRFLYEGLDWNQEEIDDFKATHATDLKDNLIVATYEALYKKYLNLYEITPTQKSRNRFPQRKRKSPRKDLSKPIADTDVSDSELVEFKESKAFHEAWGAFHAACHEPIGNGLSPGVYTRLKKEIFQAINANVKKLPTPAQLWKKGGNTKRLLAAEINRNNNNIAITNKGLVLAKKKKSMYRLRILKILFPGSKNLGQKKIDRYAVISYLGLQDGTIKAPRRQGDKKALQNVIDATKRRNAMNNATKNFKASEKDRVFFQDRHNALVKRSEELFRFWDTKRAQGGKTSAQFPIDLEWAAFHVEHQETIKNHLLEKEECAWLYKEIPEATTESIGLSLGRRIKIVDLKIKISIITDKIRLLRKNILIAIDAPASRKEVNTQDFKRYVDSQRRRYLKNVNSERERIAAATARENIEMIGNKINYLSSLLSERREYRKRLEKLKTKKEDTERKRRIASRLLTPQEAETVIFW